MEFQVLWSDDSLLVINKPSGLRTIPDGYNPSLPHLIGQLQEAHGRLWVVHRLDKDTSGVILFARSAEAHRNLNQQFEERKTRKEYHALCIGMPAWEALTISLSLVVNGDRKHRTIIDPQAGKPAETEAAVLRRLGVFTLIAALPHSGYTHQIRAHLAASSLPILNDPLYKSLKPETAAQIEARDIARDLPIRRVALHAYQIVFAHPISGQSMNIQAPYPDDLNQTIKYLQQDR